MSAKFQPPNVVIYTMGWDADQANDGTKPPTTQLKCRVTLDGEELHGVTHARVMASADFTTVTLRLYPATVRVVPCTIDDFFADVLPEPPS